MQIMVHSSHLEAKDFEHTAVEQLRFTIKQLALKVFFARIRLNMEVAENGALEKVCMVNLDMSEQGSLTIRTSGKDWPDAVEQAVERLCRLLVRSVNLSKRVRLPRPQYRLMQSSS